MVEFPLDSKHDAVAMRKLSVAVSELVIASPMARQQLASLKTSTYKQRLLSGSKPKVRAAFSPPDLPVSYKLERYLIFDAIFDIYNLSIISKDK